MSKTKITGYAFIIFLLLTSAAFAQTREMKEHKVIKGDTLWDIANAELKNPFFWPKIWKENTWIKNPNRIYPNQIVKIPVYLLKKGKLKDEAMRKDAASDLDSLETEAGKWGATAKKQPLLDGNTLMASGYIADTIPNGGKIYESPSRQFVYGDGDIVFVEFDHSVKEGERFYVIKASDMIKHPINGAGIGYVISIGGIAEIIRAGGDKTMAKITTCFREIDKGELLVPYYEMERPMTTGQFRRPNINGMIIAVRSDNQPYQSTLDIVYIDKGCKDGIETGDMFRTVAVNENAVPNGVIQVISCGEHTATAIIKSSSSIISAGDIFVDLNKN